MACRRSITRMVALSLVFSGGGAFAQSGGGHQTMKSGINEAETGHSHEMAAIHGGSVTMTPQHHFELLFTDDEARVYLYNSQQTPITDPKAAKTSMTLIRKDGQPEAMELSYVAPDPELGRTQGYFFAHRDMSGTKEGEMKATVKIVGLGKDPIEFRTPVLMGHRVSYACSMNDFGPVEDPGKCPKCGMMLTKVETEMPKGGAGDHEHGEEGTEHHH